MLAYFAVLGLTEGLWVARIPEVKAHLRLSDGLLGAALLVGPAGLVLVMPLAGWLADRLGSARLSRPAGMAVALLPVFLWRAGSLAAVIAALLAFGISGGVLDVGINAQGVRVEEAYGRPLMASFHACYSLAGLAGAVLGGLLAGRRASPLGPLAGLALTGAAVILLAGRHLADRPRPPGARAGPARGRSGARPGEVKGRPAEVRAWPGEVRARPAEAKGQPAEAKGRPGERAAAGGPGGLAGRAASQWPGRPGRMLMLGLLALSCVICEGATGSWSGVYLRGYVGAPVWLTAAGFAAFSAAMAGGRLAGDWLAVRYGPAGLVRRCGLVAAGGLAGALCSRQLAGAVIGFAACGAGLSCAIPQLLSAAGRADPDRPGAGIARVAGLGYLGLVGGPALIGGCASLFGLPLALGIPVLLGLGVAACASWLDLPRPAPAAGLVPVVIPVAVVLPVAVMVPVAVAAAVPGDGAVPRAAPGGGRPAPAG